MSKIAIIGGGAAGIFAAIAAKKRNEALEITVFESERVPLKKLSITGNGKCNITNADMDNLKEKYYTGDYSFIKNVLSNYDVNRVIDEFEHLGIRIIKRRDGYYYPACDSAKILAEMLISLADGLKIKIKTSCAITDIKKDKGQFYLYNNDYEMVFDKVLIAGGSRAGIKLSNSTYCLAKCLNHSIVPVLPSLVPLKYKDESIDILAKQRLIANVFLTVNEEIKRSEYGELQFNLGNISGIPILQLSHIAVLALENKASVSLIIDTEPERSLEELKSIFYRLKHDMAFLCLRNALESRYPKRLAELFLDRLNMNGASSLDSLSDKEIEKICSLAKRLKIMINGYSDLSAAQVAQGGVLLSEIDSHTMQSKICTGLFFAGEVLNVDGICGGYNLQFAWSTALIAASSF